MARNAVKIWYDREADFLEVLFNADPGTFEETADDRVMVRLDKKNQVVGFSIQGLSKLDRPFLDVVLTPAAVSRQHLL